jgi:CRISPR-associated Csx2 family protein
MGRKVFVSILGTSFYEECKYQHNDFLSENVRFVQEAVLSLIRSQNWSVVDVGYMLLTDKARRDNWDKSITERTKFGQENPVLYESLEMRISKMNLPFEIHTPTIPDGKNETEMWGIFKVLFDLIEDEDELYLDLTHSFRYLPMLLLVFGNYVKFLKNAKVVHISYGNYEARNNKTNIAPIIDLLPISALQDWTLASANYIENGNIKRLVELCNSELNPILRNEKTRTDDAKNLKRFINSLDKVIAERINCRGISIVSSENLKVLKQISNQLINTFIEPLNPVFDRIKLSLQDFDENENVQNGFAAVKWCLDFGLYQQAATILNENIVTFICCKNKLNWKLESDRLLVNTAFNVKIKPLDESVWKVTNKMEIDNNEKQLLIEKVKKIMKTCEIEKLKNLYISLTDLRNDFNHAGMRNNPMSAESLKHSLIEKYEAIKPILISC